jgi:hypothetical protein
MPMAELRPNALEPLPRGLHCVDTRKNQLVETASTTLRGEKLPRRFSAASVSINARARDVS